MAHTIDCPACAVTTRLSEDTFTRRVAGRRVKIVCKGCQGPFYIDATGAEPRASLIPPPSPRKSSGPPRGSAPSALAIPRAAAVPREARVTESSRIAPAPNATAPVALAPLPPPRAPGARPRPKLPPAPPRPPQPIELQRAPSLAPDVALLSVPPQGASLIAEEDLPTRPRNERAFVTSGAPAPFYEAPPTSRSLSSASLSTHPTPDVMAAFQKRRSNRWRIALPVAAVVLLAAGTLVARPQMIGWVSDLARKPEAPTERILATNVPHEVAASVRASTKDKPEPIAAVAAGAVSASSVSAPPPPPSDVTVSSRLRVPAVRDATQAEGAAPSAAPSAKPVQQPSSTKAVASEQTTKVSSTDAATAKGPAPEAAPPAPGGGFDKASAVTALQVAAAQASSCRKAGDPSGMAHVVVTFAPSGRVTSATVSGPPFAGTQTGGCIASQFRSARVPAFEGELVTVTKSVVVQ